MKTRVDIDRTEHLDYTRIHEKRMASEYWEG